MRMHRLLLDPQVAEISGGGNNSPDLEDAGNDLGISDALALLDIPEALKSSFAAKEKAGEQKAEGGGQKTEAKKPDTSPRPSPQGGEGVAAAAPTWTPEQTAWFELRNQATTPEQIAAADAKAPAFSETELAFLNAQTAELPPEGGVPIPEFTTAEQKAWVEKQKADFAAATLKATEAAAKVVELEGKVTELINAPPPEAGNIHPMALVDDPAKIDEYEASVEQFIVWAKTNWDGTEAIEAVGTTPGVPAYTAAQIRTACASREAELRKTIPAAREALAERQKQAAATRTVYPELFDTSKPAGQNVATMLRQFPILKAIFPNFHLIAGDAYRGEQLRLAEAARAKSGKPFLPVPPRPGLKTPPRPGASARAAGTLPRPKDNLSATNFQAALARNGGNDVNALAQLMMNS